ncbi:thioredoxin fold domain-containing protein [Helicobacter sp.]|uniref:thioredoxin fold domain-containing protein n=1 Tax=Helicobacter sp. TaxID=218 RepID=UPI0025B8E2C7|nr:thioredoxin fold domain-containing protein [Helicobacter sp.]MBR2495084.1 thioredoxin fold domain-containing protein [Helicobacter sp.]
MLPIRSLTFHIVCTIALCGMLCGCKDSENTTLQANDLDKKTYAGLEDVFLDTGVIETKGKYMLLVFGANGCTYCENLKSDIKAQLNLREKLKDFSAYYINTSYSKLHTFRIGEGAMLQEHSIPTRKLAEIYRIGPTPTLVFATKDGKTILTYPSYLPPKQFSALLDFIAQGSWQKANGDERQIATMLQEHLQAL